ncbi:MAG: C40 family peptidase [Bacteroidales bacterium]|nr:C40 family peptidase [Bacteroidales bacterium]
MNESICQFGFIPVRHDPDERAEMETQLLFGETYEVLEEIDRWKRIRMDYDGYEGWIDAKLDIKMFGNEVEQWRAAKKWVVPGPFAKIIRDRDRSSIIIPGGSEIYFNGTELNSFVINDETYYLAPNYNPNKQPGTIEEVAMTFFNMPYLWGGRGFFGIDCSGFTQVVNKIIGKRIPRNAYQQVMIGTDVPFVEEAKAGDLAFFDNKEGRIVHVGICLGRGEIIHSSGCVKIDKLDHQGIFVQSRRAYSHQLRAIKRI